MDYSYCAIACKIPKDLTEIIVKLSQYLSKNFGSWYILNKKEFPPHLTLWIAYVPTVNLKNIIGDSTLIFSNYRRFKVKIDKIVVENTGFTSLKFQPNEQLIKIHYELLNCLNKWRNGYIPEKYINNLNQYSPEQQISIQKFGTRMAGKLYRPHISIGVIDNKYSNDSKKSIPTQINSGIFEVSDILFFRQKSEGKSVEFLHEFNLDR